jgi:NAD(P)-dependent dehydrogenase (short-subunit alcohol dehydrogenase family)
MMGQHAIVMGGGMGIGEAISRKLHADGWTVTIVDRVAAQASSVANDLGENAFFECADITRPDQLADLAETMRERVGSAGLKAAVNSVGVFDYRLPVLKTDLANFNRMLNVNVTGAFLFSQAIEPLLANDASVVHISSVNGEMAGPTLGAYKVSKAALNMLVRVLASELARDPRRIRVNAVSPGWVDTPGERKVQAALGQPNVFNDPNAMKFIPLARMTKAEEIANAVAFLCSAGASGITGQIVPVDGGITNSEV